MVYIVFKETIMDEWFLAFPSKGIDKWLICSQWPGVPGQAG